MTSTPRERWTDERLDRFGDFVDRSITNMLESIGIMSGSITNMSESIARLTDASEEAKIQQTNTMKLFSELRANQAILQKEQGELSRERNQLLGIIAQQQSDIRGMQTENRRILDILLNEQVDPNGD